jgi:hypothetical protein
MRVSSALAMPLAAAVLLGGLQAASAQAGQPREPAASRPGSPHARTAKPAARERTPAHGPAQDEKNWMDRASSPSNGGGGGGGGGGGM